MPEIFEKWGFGMSLPKPETQKERITAANWLLGFLEGKIPYTEDSRELDHISSIKGLFNRVYREDQWDWFTVKSQLGYPSFNISKIISIKITSLRSSLKYRSVDAAKDSVSNLLRLPTRKCLSVFLGKSKIEDEPNSGWIYILSTREMNDILKIGMTTRTVEERVKEINAVTGVAIPFGVRRCWRVIDPQKSERLVHSILSENRIRKDREFFRIDFRTAAPKIQQILRNEKLEIRTLDNLASLTD